MCWIDQQEADELVARCKALVAKYGGQSERLAKVRKAYAFFSKGADAVAAILLEEALGKAENDEDFEEEPLSWNEST